MDYYEKYIKYKRKYILAKKRKDNKIQESKEKKEKYCSLPKTPDYFSPIKGNLYY